MSDYQLYQGDCLDVMAGMDASSVDAVITDPPYGIALATNYRERKRGALALCNNYLPIANDDRPFDPSPFLKFPVVVMFGPNYYAKRLPDSGAWWTWDKLDGLSSDRQIGFNDNSDCEYIWCSRGSASRIIRHRWMGAMKGSEQWEKRVHPTQKPVNIMIQLIEYFTNTGATILDPYMGGGATGIAAMLTGRNFIGIELDPGYFAIAEERIAKAAQMADGQFVDKTGKSTDLDSLPLFQEAA